MQEQIFPCSPLCSGHSMPRIGLRAHCYVKDQDAIKAMQDAIDLGYRYFDTAASYGNEEQVGLGIRSKIDEGNVKRADLFIATKLWNTYHEPHMVERGCRNSLQKLRLSYIDLYLMHSPMGFAFRGDSDIDLLPENPDSTIAFNEIDYVDTYKAMEKLVDEGLVRSLGVCNFNSDQIVRLLDKCTIKPAVNQIEITACLQQRELRQFCNVRGIEIVAHSPLGYPFSNEPKSPALSDVNVEGIARKYGKTTEQVVLNYLIKLDIFILPHATTKEEMRSILESCDLDLDNDEIDVMKEFDTGKRTVALKRFITHKFYPFHIAF